jgi:ankyrin repeat protein
MYDYFLARAIEADTSRFVTANIGSNEKAFLLWQSIFNTNDITIGFVSRFLERSKPTWNSLSAQHAEAVLVLCTKSDMAQSTKVASERCAESNQNYKFHAKLNLDSALKGGEFRLCLVVFNAETGNPTTQSPIFVKVDQPKRISPLIKEIVIKAQEAARKYTRNFWMSGFDRFLQNENRGGSGSSDGMSRNSGKYTEISSEKIIGSELAQSIKAVSTQSEESDSEAALALCGKFDVDSYGISGGTRSGGILNCINTKKPTPSTIKILPNTMWGPPTRRGEATMLCNQCDKLIEVHIPFPYWPCLVRYNFGIQETQTSSRHLTRDQIASYPFSCIPSYTADHTAFIFDIQLMEVGKPLWVISSSVDITNERIQKQHSCQRCMTRKSGQQGYQENQGQDSKLGNDSRPTESFNNDEIVSNNQSVVTIASLHPNLHPLFIAAFNGSIDDLASLILNGTDPCLVDEYGFSALFYGILGNHLDVVKFLVVYSSEISSIHCNNRMTVLHFVSHRGLHEFVEILLSPVECATKCHVQNWQSQLEQNDGNDDVYKATTSSSQSKDNAGFTHTSWFCHHPSEDRMSWCQIHNDEETCYAMNMQILEFICSQDENQETAMDIAIRFHQQEVIKEILKSLLQIQRVLKSIGVPIDILNGNLILTTLSKTKTLKIHHFQENVLYNFSEQVSALNSNSIKKNLDELISKTVRKPSIFIKFKNNELNVVEVVPLKIFKMDTIGELKKRVEEKTKIVSSFQQFFRNGIFASFLFCCISFY